MAGCEAKLRMNADGSVYVTDNHNYIVDLYFKNEPIKNAKVGSLQECLSRFPRVGLAMWAVPA